VNSNSRFQTSDFRGELAFLLESEI